MISNATNAAAVQGNGTANQGVTGQSQGSDGVYGVSHAAGKAGVAGVNDDQVGNGVYGHAAKGNGVIGYSTAPTGYAGVAGSHSAAGNGVYGESQGSDGVYGISHAAGKAGVTGVNDDAVGNGVYGEAKQGNGVYGVSSAAAHAGVAAVNNGGGTGLYALSNSSEAVHAQTTSDKGAAIAGYNLGQGPAVYGKGTMAAVFEGIVTITGDLRLTNADLAEQFDVKVHGEAEPGTVMVIDDDGGVEPCRERYDRRALGVVSGAGAFKPAIILDQQPSLEGRVSIALVGKVYCKVDAEHGAIAVGDLLTTSQTPGHAMRVADPARAFGAVIGKALRSVASGRSMIPIVVTLQ